MTVSASGDLGVGVVTVVDTRPDSCGDGDYDLGIGGGAFGYGAWVNEPECNYGLNEHGPNVAVDDVVWGSAVGFVVGEDDQGGPTKITDPTTGVVACETSGSLRPCPDGDPAQCGPTHDMDDCLSPRYVGVGATCGTGGGDGLFWVFLDGAFAAEDGGGGLSAESGPTAGTITAF